MRRRGTAKSLPGNKMKGGGPARKTVFVSRLGQSVTEENINRFLMDNNIQAANILQTSHEEARFKRVRFYVDDNTLTKALEPSLWPDNCYIKQFFESRNRGHRERGAILCCEIP